MRRGWYTCAVLVIISVTSAWAIQGTDSTIDQSITRHKSLVQSTHKTERIGIAAERTSLINVAEPKHKKSVWERLLEAPLAVALVAWVGSFLISWWKAKREIRAAGISADAVRDAGLKHAIETEALKLRYAIGRHHADMFYHVAGPLHAALRGLPYADDAGVKDFHNRMYPHVLQSVVEHAEMTVPPELYGHTYSIEKTFTDAVQTLMKRLITADPNPDARPRTEAEEIVDLSIVSGRALLYLMRVVDLSLELRASSSRDATAEFNAMLERWEKERRKLPAVPPDSSGIAGTGS